MPFDLLGKRRIAGNRALDSLGVERIKLAIGIGHQHFWQHFRLDRHAASPRSSINA